MDLNIPHFNIYNINLQGFRITMMNEVYRVDCDGENQTRPDSLKTLMSLWHLRQIKRIITSTALDTRCSSDSEIPGKK